MMCFIKVFVITALTLICVEALTANSSLTTSNTTSDILLSHPFSEHSVTREQSLTNKSVDSNREEKKLNFQSEDCLCEEKVRLDSGSCPGRRIITKPSCNCQLICAKQSGESCSEQTPCDTDFGFQCNPDIGVCEGKLLVQKFDITHNSLKIRWRSLKLSQLSPNTTVFISVIPSSGSNIEWTKIETESNFSNKSFIKVDKLRPNTDYYVRVEENGSQETIIARTKDGCYLNSSKSVAIGERYNVGCEQVCICYQSGRTECRDRCEIKIGSGKNSSCKEIPDEKDPECCLKYQCTSESFNHSFNENAPKVLVTQRSQTSISIAFDDFKLPNYESGYVVQYKPIENNSNNDKHNENRDQSNITSNSTESDWIQIQANNTPFVTIKDLRPHSAYQIQVLVWEDIDTKKLGLGSEVITVFTEDGCFRNNTTYEIGEEFFEGCDLRCICRGSDEGECSDRCNQPFVRAGTMNGNPKCTETPSPEDACCVSVKCTNHPQEGRTNEAIGFSDKPGFCPISIDGRDGTAPKCKQECSHDYHCTGLKKCCKTLCGGTICVNSVPKKISCENITCGLNAYCEIEDNVANCRCQQGFSGDPKDTTNGCVRNTKPNLMCFYKNSHYSPGQSFNDSCQLCICSEALEVECSDRCTHKVNDLVPSDCTLIKDPKDECCKILDCETRIENTTSIIDLKPSHNTTNNNSSHLSPMPKPIDGCMHNNQTFTDGDVFFIDCQLRCLCQSHGRLQCVPRCALDPGYDEAYCRLVTDPDDPECCKIAVCDKKDTISDKPEILIDSAEAYNSSSVKLRVMIPSLKNGVLGSNLKLLFSIISVNETESEKGNDSREWQTIDIVEESIKVIATDIYEIDFGGLMSQTDYFIRVKMHNASSNTVFVRTYPPGIDITFNGCFHGNRTIEVGQVFYEGDCEYKCVCREGGLRECEERCPIYIDTVGYENCDWGPAPDDPCCTVPICDKTNKKNLPHDPDAEPFCISEAGKVYKIGQSWDTGTNCLKKSCQCSLLPNGTTGVLCKGGCATLPSNAQQPSPQCPSPQIVQPDDPCICPYVVCQNNLNPLDLPEKNTPSRDKNFCEFKGRKIAIGEEIYDNCRAVCHCGHDARLNCAAIECPHNFAPHVSDCLEWDIDPNFIPTPPNCCPQPKCKNDGSCSFAGIRFPNFKHIPQELLPCGTRCVCSKGKVDCENRCPPVPDIPPPHMPCPPAMAYRGHLPGDSCCLHWLCRDQEKSTNDCSHNGKRYKVGEQWDDKGGGFKRRCQCKLTNGVPHAQCHPGGCPPITDRFLQPTVDCPNPSIIIPDDPVVLCPYVICNDSKDSGRDLEHVNIVAINSTSARIRFTLPSLLVGLIGHAELHYTTDLNIPRSQWNIQKFARPKRLFDTQNIEYHLGNLSPDTTYFFQIQVVIEALQSGPESEIYKLYLPPIPSSSTSSPTSTTTTTVPPMIMLDVQLNAVSNDYSSLKVSWRQFSPQEKKFIDGIQIRYKKAEQDENEWQFTQILHRDVRSYVLRDLHPGVSYAVDLVFNSNPDIPTHIISTKPIVIDMPSEPKDEFDIHVILTPNDVNVDAFQTQIKLNGLPLPVNKYINVAKISYRSDQSMELLHAFKVPNENGKLILDGLEPNKRYKAWIDLYLANGKTVSSNAIEFTTKEKPPKINKIDTSANEAEALRENEVMDTRYFYCLVIVSSFAAVTGIGFVVVLYFLLRKQSTAKAPITRAPSESAYDNPTYKTYDVGERPVEENMKNGTIQA